MAALLLFPTDAERGGHGSLGGGGAQGLQSQAPRAGSGLFHFSCFFIRFTMAGMKTALENVTFTVTFSVKVVVKTASINRFCLPW